MTPRQLVYTVALACGWGLVVSIAMDITTGGADWRWGPMAAVLVLLTRTRRDRR